MDYSKVIEGSTKTIELNPRYANAYVQRGIAKSILKDLSGACNDWEKAVSLGDATAAKWVKDQCY